MHKIKGVIALLSIALMTSAHANIQMNSIALTENDICSKIDGQWSGRGVVKANVGPISVTCRYSGTGNLVLGALPNTFVMDILLRVDSGACPDNVRLSMPGNCHDGVVDLKTDNANLNGTISSDAKSAELNGNVTIPILGREVTANVEDMHLTKQ